MRAAVTVGGLRERPSAALVATFVVAAGHGLRITGGERQFSTIVMAVVGTLGFGVVWLRQRTELLVIPVVEHNLVNAGNTFF